MPYGKSRMKILVIGAGPVGLTVALEFAHHGVKPELVEKRSGPSEFSRAVGMLPVTRYHLRHEGVGDSILREAVPWRKFQFFRGDKTLLDLDLSKTVKPEDCMLGLPQDRTEGLIREALERLGVQTHYNTEVTYVEAAVDQAKVTFADGRIDTYDWVVACDGKHSSTREQLGIGYEGYDLPELWSIADIDLNEDFDCEKTQWWIQGENGHIATCLPIERFRARALSSTPDALAAIPLDLGITNVRRAGTFEISVRQATSYIKGCILLAGDAAHCHSPVGGRGMNLGIGDAVAAAQAILNGTTESYGDKRHVAGTKILKMTEATRREICSNRIIDRVKFNVKMRLVQNISLLHPAFVRQLTRMP